MTTASRVSDSRVTDAAKTLISIVKRRNYSTLVYSPENIEAFTAACLLEAALACQGPMEGWRPIETAPEGVPCIVGWIDENGDQSDFDIYDEGCWQEHENRRDHFLSVAPPGSRGPKEKAPYTHWMPLHPVPTNDLTALIAKANGHE